MVVAGKSSAYIGLYAAGLLLMSMMSIFITRASRDNATVLCLLIG